jgi:hypothetical protein
MPVPVTLEQMLAAREERVRHQRQRQQRQPVGRQRRLLAAHALLARRQHLLQRHRHGRMAAVHAPSPQGLTWRTTSITEPSR